VESSEDKDVLDAEPAIESEGETLTELAVDEAAVSVVTVLLRTGFWGRAVVAAMFAVFVAGSEEGRESKI